MNHQTKLSNPHKMDLVQWQRLKVISHCSQSTTRVSQWLHLILSESNGHEFDLKMLSFFFGFSLFFSILLCLSLKDFLRHLELETANTYRSFLSKPLHAKLPFARAENILGFLSPCYNVCFSDGDLLCFDFHGKGLSFSMFVMFVASSISTAIGVSHGHLAK